METGFLLMGILWLSLTLLALRLWRGRWRKAAALCGGTMLLAIAVGVLGGMAGANMAPIWIFLALPVCTVGIMALCVARGIAHLRGR